MTCPKLLNNGTKGKYGCDGTNCTKLHPKMCSISLSYQRCSRDCTKGYHIRDNSKMMVIQREKDEKMKKEREEKERKKVMEKEMRRKEVLQGTGLPPPQGTPPPALPQGPTTSEAFLVEEIRGIKEILRMLVLHQPSGPSAPGPAPAMAPPPATPAALTWVEVMRRTLQ